MSAPRAATVGSGYRPSAWCPACHAPYPSTLPRCPECAPPVPGTPEGALIVRLLTGDVRALRPDHVAHLAGITPAAAAALMAELEAAGYVALGPDGRWGRA